MEFSEIILTLVGIVSTISAWVVVNLVADIRKLNEKMTDCQTNMPKEYMLKQDYTADATEIKFEIRELSKKIDQVWKHIRIDNGKD